MGPFPGCCGCGGTPTGFLCGTCTIPLSNLTLTFTPGGIIAPVTAVWNGNSSTPVWTAPIVSGLTNFCSSITLSCGLVAGNPTPCILAIGPPSPSCGNCSGPTGTSLVSCTSSPFQLVFFVANGTSCSADQYDALQFTLTYTP